MKSNALLVLIALAATGCPKSSDRAASEVKIEPHFECNQRRAEYVVTGGFAGAEAGVIAECSKEKPRLTKWTQADDGQRDEEKHFLDSETFDDIWKVIDNTGWRHIQEECDNPDAADSDPIYTIEIVDYAVTKTLTCQGKELPFPYHQLVRELDVRAAAAGQ